MADPRKRSVDPASQQMLACARESEACIAWDRLEEQEPQCGFGSLGLCCRHCTMGPCRVDPFGEGPKAGVCGATGDTIVALPPEAKSPSPVAPEREASSWREPTWTVSGFCDFPGSAVSALFPVSVSLPSMAFCSSA